MSTSLPERVGRYEIVERLGTGGMGVVYLATDPLLRRTVAVKVLPGESDDLRERFAREARSAAALRHNNIVTIYDVGEHNGQPFIAMEFIDGESMAEMIRRRAPLALPRRLQLMIELCAGLGYAHRSGIVHRDVKPANLMVTSEGGLKILDFGLARVVAEPTLGRLTGVGTLLGTPNYLAPEQISGTAGDRASDIFSAGLVLYEFVSYRKAFPGDSGPAILFDIVEREPTPIRQLLPDIDDELESVVTHAVEKDRTRRYADLGLLAEALERVRARLARAPDDSTGPKKPRRKSPSYTGTTIGDGLAADQRHQRLGAIAQKRAAQIAEHLAAASSELQSGRPQAAIEHCEHTLLLDPDDEQALELLKLAHHALEDAQVGAWLDQAKGHLERGALTEAEQLIQQSLQLRADRSDVLSLQDELKQRRRDHELLLERQRSAVAAVERARANLGSGAFEAVIRSASEALAFVPDHAEARELKSRAASMLEEQRRHQAQAEVVEPSAEPAPAAILPARAATAPRVPQRASPAPSSPRPSPRVLIAAAVLVLAVVGAWVMLSRSAAPPPPVVAQVEPPPPPPPAPPVESVAEQNAARYRELVEQADQRVAAQDAEGAAALILEAEKILPGDPRLRDLAKQVDDIRAAAQKAQQRDADINQALAQAAKLPDGDAIARLQRELARYPGTPELSQAIAARTRTRDDKIAALVRRAQTAEDAEAIALLEEALGYNASRADLRRELDKRKAALAARAAAAEKPRDPQTASREEVENDVREALYAYQSAYAGRSVDDVLKVAPFQTREQLEAEFSRFRSIQLLIEGVTIVLADNRTRAAVRCTISTVSVPANPSARPVMDKRAWQFQLAYAGGAWQIIRAVPR